MKPPLQPAIDRVLRCIAAEVFPSGMTVKDICRRAQVGIIVADEVVRILRTEGIIDRPLSSTGRRTGYMLTEAGRAWVAENISDAARV